MDAASVSFQDISGHECGHDYAESADTIRECLERLQAENAGMTPK